MSSPAQRERHREQRENTRREILSVAGGFLRERPYRELSVEVVMAQTGLSRTAFYRHFDDVTDLVLKLLEEAAAELYKISARWAETAGHEFPSAARIGLGGVVEFFRAQGPLVRAIAEAAVTDERIEEAYRGFLETFINTTARSFDALVERGQLAPFDTRSVARALNLMNERYLLDEFGREPFGDADVALATLETIWRRSVGPMGPPHRAPS